MTSNNDLQPVNITGISKPGSKKNAWKSGGVMAANSHFGSAPIAMDFMNQNQAQIQNQPLLRGNINSKQANQTQRPKKMTTNSNMKQETYALEVLQTETMPTIESKLNKGQQAIFVPSKVPMQGLQEAPPMLNLNTVTISETPDRALERVKELLGTAHFDVVFTSDDQNYLIEGTAFFDELPSGFKVIVYVSGAGSVVSVLRQSGCNSMAFSRFFEWMEKRLSGSDENKDDDFPGMMAMPTLSATMMSISAEELDGYSQQDLDMFVQDIQDDLYQVETLGLVFDLEGETVANHPALAQAVLQCTKSTDIAVQRLALKICAKAELTVDDVQSDSALILKYFRKVSNKI